MGGNSSSISPLDTSLKTPYAAGYQDFDATTFSLSAETDTGSSIGDDRPSTQNLKMKIERPKARPLRHPVPPKHSCPNAPCSVECNSERSLDRHLLLRCKFGEQRTASVPIWRCKCERAFDRWDKFLSHKKCTKKEGTYVCQCGRVFTDRETFQQHHKDEYKKRGPKSKNDKARNLDPGE